MSRVGLGSVELGTFSAPFEPAHVQHEQGHSHQQHHVRNVEDPGKKLRRTAGPVPSERQPVPRQHVEEVADHGVCDAVVQVADAAGENQPNGKMGEVVAIGGETAKHEQPSRQGRQRKGDEEEPLVLPHAKHSAAIDHQLKIKQSPGQHLNAAMERNRVVVWIGQERFAIKLHWLAGNSFKRPVFRSQVER
jgi:hypothetical protein